jgi:hypothetical protein
MTNKTEFFKVKIIKATPLLFESTYHAPFHEHMVGKVKLVRRTSWDGAYFECKTGESILKQDVQIVKKVN